ncbi:MAG: DinB family protein [Bacteroidota bacterium]
MHLTRSDIRILVEALDRAYELRSWHGPNLRGSIRGLTSGEASRRPAPGRHNIREIVLHAAYWKYAVRRRLTGAPRGSFPLKGSNWFARGAAGGGSSWEEERKILDREHRRLRKALAAPAAGGPGAPSRPGPETLRMLLEGIAAHDLYHAGQIRLIRRLMRR